MEINKNITSIKNACDMCGGEGSISKCCQAEIEDGKCYQCGRFTSEEHCYECDAQGYIEYSVDDEVEVFVCVYSPKGLKEKLFNSKKLGDVKTFQGKILGFTDKWNAVVKIKRKKEPIEISINDLILI